MTASLQARLHDAAYLLTDEVLSTTCREGAEALDAAGVALAERDAEIALLRAEAGAFAWLWDEARRRKAHAVIRYDPERDCHRFTAAIIGENRCDAVTAEGAAHLLRSTLDTGSRQ